MTDEQFLDRKKKVIDAIKYFNCIQNVLTKEEIAESSNIIGKIDCVLDMYEFTHKRYSILSDDIGELHEKVKNRLKILNKKDNDKGKIG